jgi:hypothetical protein
VKRCITARGLEYRVVKVYHWQGDWNTEFNIAVSISEKMRYKEVKMQRGVSLTKVERCITEIQR